MLAFWLPLLLAAQISFPQKPVRKTAAPATLLGVQRVWDKAPYNSFTDLVRFRERFYLAFREGQKHVSPDGAIRILMSQDAEHWEALARLDYPVADLRDPHLSVTPDDKLMLVTGGAMHPPYEYRFKTFVWYSTDGRQWTSAENIGDPNVWLWRVVWHEGKGFGFGYSTGDPHFVRTYMSPGGEEWSVYNPSIDGADYPNESATVFVPGDAAVCLLRRDGGSKTALLGRSVPPYRAWTWQDLGVRVGGPALIRIPDGRLVAVVRLYDGKQRTSLCWLDTKTPKLEEFMTLPSGGDTSYAGLVYHNDVLYVSYYSSHEEKTAVYLARVKINVP